MKDDYAEEDILAANARLWARDDEEDDLDFEDDWEDTQAILKEREKYPGWLFMKITGFSGATFHSIEKWCRENCRDQWAKVGWSSGCSYTVAVAFRDYRDALMYKLTWQG